MCLRPLGQLSRRITKGTLEFFLKQDPPSSSGNQNLSLLNPRLGRNIRKKKSRRAEIRLGH